MLCEIQITMKVIKLNGENLPEITLESGIVITGKDLRKNVFEKLSEVEDHVLDIAQIKLVYAGAVVEDNTLIKPEENITLTVIKQVSFK